MTCLTVSIALLLSVFHRIQNDWRSPTRYAAPAVFWNKGLRCKAHEYTPQGAEEWVEYKARRAKKPQHTGVCEDF